MSEVTRNERPNTVIKPEIVQLSQQTKDKIAAAFQTVINKIKEKHL